MKIFRGRLSKAELVRIPEHERKLFLAIAHLQNEVSILLRAVLWSSDFSSDNEAVVQGQLSASFFFLKLLAGKLNEGKELLNKCFFKDRTLSCDFRSHATPTQIQALDEISRYFGKTNILNTVRNDFAFHYSPSALDDALTTVTDELDLYIEDGGNANTLYYFAEILANHAVLNHVDVSDGANPMERLHEEILKVAYQFIRFGQGFMRYVLKRHTPYIWKEPVVPISFNKLPSFSEIRLPWFADTTNGLWDKDIE